MNMLKFLKTNSNTRKIFGKRELKIIEKQLNGVSLTQSEKNRLSRDIRKKFEFTKEVSKFQNEFGLKRSQLINEKINESLEVIRQDKDFNKIKKIFLFGSAVENKLNLTSDIDIAVEFKEITKKEVFHFRARISGRVSEKIDVQVFNTLPKKVKQSILNNHRILYVHEQKRGKN